MTTNVESSAIFNDDIDDEIEAFPVLADSSIFSSLSKQQQFAVAYASRARRIILNTDFPLNSLKQTDAMIIRMVIAHFSFLKGLENDGVQIVPLTYDGQSFAGYEDLLKQHARLFYQMMAVRAERKNEDSVQACRRDFTISDKLYSFACSTTHFFMYTNPRPYGTDLYALNERIGVDGAGYVAQGHKAYDNVLVEPETFNDLSEKLQSDVVHLSAQRKYLRFMTVEEHLFEFSQEFYLSMTLRGAGVDILDYDGYANAEEAAFVRKMTNKRVRFAHLIEYAKINADPATLAQVRELYDELKSHGFDV